MLQRAEECNRAHLDSATATRVATYHIGQPLERSATHGLTNTDTEIHSFINTMVYLGNAACVGRYLAYASCRQGDSNPVELRSEDRTVVIRRVVT